VSNVIRHVVSNIAAVSLLAFAGTTMAFDLGGKLGQVQQAAQKQVPQAQAVQAQSPQQATPNSQSVQSVSTSAAAQPKPDGSGKLFEQIVSLVAIPASASYTANGWDVLAKTFPKAKWKDAESKTYPTSRATTIKNPDGVLTIVALGNRSMLVNVEASYDSPEGAPLFRDFLDSSPKIRKVCAIDESADSAEIYYQANLGGLKPVTVKYEYSAGSGGGGDSITAGEIDLPASCGKKSVSTAKGSAQAGRGASTVTVIPSEFQGWWAGNCKDALKAAKHDELIGYQIKAGSVHQMELHCMVKQVTQVSPNSGSKQLQVNTSCDSPDGVSEWKIALELNPAGKLIVSDPAGKTIKPEVLSRCGK
jgi:hypothetical protein